MVSHTIATLEFRSQNRRSDKKENFRCLLEAMTKDAAVKEKPSVHCFGYSLITLLHPDIQNFQFAQNIVFRLVRKHYLSLENYKNRIIMSEGKLCQDQMAGASPLEESESEETEESEDVKVL